MTSLLSQIQGDFVLLGIGDKGKVIGETLTNKIKTDIVSLARNCDPDISITRITRRFLPKGLMIMRNLKESGSRTYPAVAQVTLVSWLNEF